MENIKVTLPDGSEKRFRKTESGYGRNKRISVQESVQEVE